MDRRSLLAAAVAAPLLTTTSRAATAQRVGTAVDAASGAMLYRESHVETYEGDRLTADRVSYTDPSGQRFATKQVQFFAGSFVPSFRFENRRTGHLEACQPLGGDMVEVSFREGGDGPVETRELSAPRDTLADAGFDRFIEAEWDAMTSGQPLVRPFLVPGRFELIDFRLRDAGGMDGGGAQRFAMEIDSFLLRLLAPTILIDYDRETRRLLRYEGPSNLRDASGNNYDVVITF